MRRLAKRRPLPRHLVSHKAKRRKRGFTDAGDRSEYTAHCTHRGLVPRVGPLTRLPSLDAGSSARSSVGIALIVLPFIAGYLFRSAGACGRAS